MERTPGTGAQPERGRAFAAARHADGASRTVAAVRATGGGAPSHRRPIVAVLAVQGAFVEHERKLAQLGANCVELRQRPDLEKPFDALVLPGGESTVQGKLLRELGMLEPLRERVAGGLPVLATCAGMILLAERVAQGDGPYLATVPMTVRRNAYGRQLDSFRTEGEVAGIGQVPMTFIRAPYVESVRPGAEVLAEIDGKAVAVRSGNQLALSFHPELDISDAVHEAFPGMIGQGAKPGRQSLTTTPKRRAMPAAW